MNTDTPILTLPKPSLLNIIGESRCLFELGFTGLVLPLLSSAPKGDGHPVMVLPGFMASDISTKPLRSFLKHKGYQAYGWGLGRNFGTEIVGGDQVLSEKLLNQVKAISRKHGQKVSLVGWSLGGILSREIARIIPQYVRQVITLGSPFNGPGGSVSAVAKLFDFINGDIVQTNPKVLSEMLTPPPVPSSALFSKSDGVAHWKACINIEIGPNDQAENIEVSGSHTGLGHNFEVIWIVANRLAQSEDNWQPYSTPTKQKNAA